MEYRKGKLNCVPDALSRTTKPSEVPPSCNTIQATPPANPPFRKKEESVFPLDDEELWRAQQAEPAIMEIH